MARWFRAAAYAASGAAIAMCAVLVVVLWTGVDRDLVPVHWNGSFTPDRYGSKLEAALGAAVPIAVVVACFALLAGVTRPRHDSPSLMVLWIVVVAFVSTVTMATAGQTIAGTEVGRSSWFSSAFFMTVAVAGLLAGAAGHVVAGRPPAEARRRRLRPPEQPYWFRAKRYGYGWGRPSTWQGWVAFAGYLVVILTPVLMNKPEAAMVALLVATPALLWVCLRHGEPTGWRWGDRDGT